MKKRIVKVITLVFVFYLLIMAGCVPPGTGPEPTEEPGITEKTIMFGEENGEVRFYTNDKQFIFPEGYSFWIAGDTVTETMATLETRCYKISGDQYGGYGLIFSIRDIDNFLAVVITVKGNYCIGKSINKEFFTIKPWTSSSSLIPNFGSRNTIRIFFNQDNRYYEVYFNGNKEIEFQDNSDPILEEKGRYGYIASLAPYEKFPEEGVDVRFCQLTPESIQMEKRTAACLAGINASF